MTTADRRLLFTVLDEAGSFAARAKAHITTDADGPLTMERLNTAIKARIQCLAALAEAAAIMDRMKIEMIIGKPESEAALEGAVSKMLDSGDLDLDDEDRIACEQAAQVDRTLAATVRRMGGGQ